MTNLIFLTFSYLALLIETTFWFLGIFNYIHFDPIPALINWYALREQPRKGSLFITFFSIMASLFSFLPFAAFFIAYLLAFWIINYIKSNLLELNKIQIHFFTFFISIEIQVILLLWSGRPELLWPFGMVQAIINMAISPIVFVILNRTIKILTYFFGQQNEPQKQ